MRADPRGAAVQSGQTALLGPAGGISHLSLVSQEDPVGLHHYGLHLHHLAQEGEEAVGEHLGQGNVTASNNSGVLPL